MRYLQISLEVVVAQRRKIKVRRNQPESKEDDSKSILQYIAVIFVTFRILYGKIYQLKLVFNNFHLIF